MASANADNTNSNNNNSEDSQRKDILQKLTEAGFQNLENIHIPVDSEYTNGTTKMPIVIQFKGSKMPLVVTLDKDNSLINNTIKEFERKLATPNYCGGDINTIRLFTTFITDAITKARTEESKRAAERQARASSRRKKSSGGGARFNATDDDDYSDDGDGKTATATESVGVSDEDKAAQRKERKRKNPDVEIHKFTGIEDDDGNPIVYESVFLEDEQKPMFIYYDKDLDAIQSAPYIVDPNNTNRKLLPLVDKTLYQPYSYGSLDEINDVWLHKAKKHTLDSLLEKQFHFVETFNTQPKEVSILFAANPILTYFQDKYATCHYPTTYSKSGHGKSSNGLTFACIANNCVFISDPSAANIFRMYGNIEPGQVSMAIDEAQRISDKTSEDMLSTLKSGYMYDGKIPKINHNNGKQTIFFCYGIKFIMGDMIKEELPEGVTSRQFIYYAKKDKPKRPGDNKESSIK